VFEVNMPSATQTQFLWEEVQSSFTSGVANFGFHVYAWEQLEICTDKNKLTVKNTKQEEHDDRTMMMTMTQQLITALFLR